MTRVVHGDRRVDARADVVDPELVDEVARQLVGLRREVARSLRVTSGQQAFVPVVHHGHART